MHPLVEHPENLIGTAVDELFHPLSVEATTDEAIVYLCQPFCDVGRWYDPEDKVGEPVFLVLLKHPIELTSDEGFSLAKKRQLRAMTQVEPSVAGFPEWNKLYADDGKKIAGGEIDGLMWAAIRITTYRRKLHKLISESRRSQNFSARDRRRFIKQAGDQCQRCGSKLKLEIDHIIPVAFAGTNDETNAMVLCHECHLAKSRAERNSFGQTLSYPGEQKPPSKKQLASPRAFLKALARRSGWSLNEKDNSEPPHVANT